MTFRSAPWPARTPSSLIQGQGAARGQRRLQVRADPAVHRARGAAGAASDRGFTVLGFPCNQFGGQEPGTRRGDREFCSATYGVTFPMFEKIEVNGPGRHPIYDELTAVPDADGEAGDIQWNFEKFLLAPGRQRGGAVPADDDARRPRGARRDRGKPAGPAPPGSPLRPPRTAPSAPRAVASPPASRAAPGRDITVHTTRFWPGAHCRACASESNVPGMTTFVLVHGAWGGSYGFRTVRGPLRAAGHEVFTPSLTGIGERAHLASPQVTLTTHVTDVVNTVLYEDLSDIVLLGYSYGGMVVTGALEHIADRVGAPGLPGRVPARRRPVAGRPGPAPAMAERRSGQAANGWCPRWPALRRRRRSRLALRPPLAAPGRLLHRAGPAGRPLEEYPFTRTYIKATAEPHAGRWTAGTRSGRPPTAPSGPGVALPGDRHRPHDPGQEASGARGAAARAHLAAARRTEDILPAEKAGPVQDQNVRPPA